MEKHDDELLGEFIDDEKCPKCGATLLGNKRGDKWCSNAVGPGRSACSYGIMNDGTSRDEYDGAK